MKTTFISFNFKSISGYLDRISIFNKDYDKTYKPLGTFLYANPDFPFSFSFTGSQSEYFKRNRGEFSSILRIMIARKQVEVVGGGLVNPVFPLISSSDRYNQIEFLSTSIRKVFGKRPRGIALNPDIWDASLLNNINACNVLYLFLDNSLIPEDKQLFCPIVMSEAGKSIDIYPYYTNLNPSVDMEPREFLDRIVAAVQEAEPKVDFGPYNEYGRSNIVNINIDHILMTQLCSVQWFERFYEFYKSHRNEYKEIFFSTTSDYHNTCRLKIPAYIHTGIADSLGKYCGKPFVVNEGYHEKRNTIFDFLETYYQNKALYCRMLYITMLVNQYRNDKIRKKVARDTLSRGQSGNGIVWIDDCVNENVKARQQTYQYFMEAENMLRSDSMFKPAIALFDYNNDGENEYVCRMAYFFAYATVIGGMLLHVEPVFLSGNYADNLSKMKLFDGVEDNYRRGFFVEHFIEDEEFDHYVNNEDFGGSIFGGKLFKQVAGCFNRYNFKLTVDSNTNKTRQKVNLTKEYTLTKDSITVVYNLKNESNSTLKGKFAVECNFLCFNPRDGRNLFYAYLAIVNNKLIKNDNRCKDRIIKNISQIKVIDQKYENVFVFTPGDECNYVYNVICFNRPDRVRTVIPAQYDYVSTLYWDVDLKPGETLTKKVHLLINEDDDKKEGVINPISLDDKSSKFGRYSKLLEEDIQNKALIDLLYRVGMDSV